MKIWFVTMQFPASREVFANNDVVTLKRLGHNISVHSLRPKHKSYNKIVNDRKLEEIGKTHNSFKNNFIGVMYGIINPLKFFSIFYFIIRNHYSALMHLTKSLILLPRVLQLFFEFEKERPEVIHLYWAHYPSLLGYLIKKFYPKTILSMNFVAYDLHQRFKGSFIVADMADCVFSITKYDRKTLINLGINSNKIKTIYHGLLPEVFNYAQKEKTKGRIISVGAFIPGKNMDKVIRIFYQIQKTHPKVSLVLLGDGPMMKELKKIVDKLKLTNVSFMGHVSHDVVIEQMSVAEIFLFLSQDERLPNVIKEAMSQRCVSITSRTPGIEELIKSEEYGLVLKSDKLEVISEVVSNVLDNHDLISRITTNAYNFVKEHFDNVKNVKIMLNFWTNQHKD